METKLSNSCYWILTKRTISIYMWRWMGRKWSWCVCVMLVSLHYFEKSQTQKWVLYIQLEIWIVCDEEQCLRNIPIKCSPAEDGDPSASRKNVSTCHAGEPTLGTQSVTDPVEPGKGAGSQRMNGIIVFCCIKNERKKTPWEGKVCIISLAQ